MSCDISAGRALPCRDSVGGLKAVYIANYGSSSYYQFDLKGNSSLTQNIQASRENGTVAFEQVLELTLPKLSATDNATIKLLSYGRPHIVVEDYNGNYLLVGKEHGADVTGGTIVTGAAMGDLSGYTLTFTAMEKEPAELSNTVPTLATTTTTAAP